MAHVGIEVLVSVLSFPSFPFCPHLVFWLLCSTVRTWWQAGLSASQYRNMDWILGAKLTWDGINDIYISGGQENKSCAPSHTSLMFPSRSPLYWNWQETEEFWGNPCVYSSKGAAMCELVSWFYHVLPWTFYPWESWYHRYMWRGCSWLGADGSHTSIWCRFIREPSRCKMPPYAPWPSTT